MACVPFRALDLPLGMEWSLQETDADEKRESGGCHPLRLCSTSAASAAESIRRVVIHHQCHNRRIEWFKVALDDAPH